MSFDDLSISNISKRPSLTDLAGKDAEEWKFSDCLRLHHRNNSIFEDSETTNTRKSSLENQPDELNDFINSEKENESQLQYSMQDKKPIKKNISKNNSSNRIPLSPVDILKQNNTLHNIPEAEAEETPLSKTHTSRIHSYLRNTISFSQHSADISSGSQSQKKKTAIQRSDKGDNHQGFQENRNHLTSSVRRLFMPDQQIIGGGQTPSSAGCTPTQKPPRNSQQKEAKPKVDSNRKGKVYHDEIVRKNRTGGIEQILLGQTNLTNVSCITAADSVDLSMTSLVNSIQTSNAKFCNDQNSNYEDFHNILAGSNQNERVKLKYYEYLLEEAQVSQENFVNKIANLINNEKEVLGPGERIACQLLEGIENQRKRIIDLEKEVTSLTAKATQLSQLVVLFKEQIVSMNNESAETSSFIKQMQDELSTVTLMFQLGNQYSTNCEIDQDQDQTSRYSSFMIEQMLENLKSTAGQFIQNAQQSQFNTQQLNQLRYQMRELLKIRGTIQGEQLIQYDQQYPDRFSEDETIILSLQSKLEKLQDNIRQSETRAQIAQKKEEELRQKLNDLSISTEQHSLQEKNQFQDFIKLLKKQINVLQGQQVQLEKSLQKQKIDNKLEFHEQLVKKLKCKIIHTSDHGTAVSKDITQQNQQIQIYQHQQFENKTEIICDLLRVLDQLETAVFIDSNGGMSINVDLLQGIRSKHLKNWTSTYINNMQISIQQLIKRQIEKQIQKYQLKQFTDQQILKLKRIIYQGDYDGYFEQLFLLLKEQPM